MHLTHAGALTKMVVVTFMTYLVIMLLTVVGEVRTTQSVRDQLQQDVYAMEEENQKMSHALEYKDDPEMLERVARARGYIKVGETPFIDTSK